MKFCFRAWQGEETLLEVEERVCQRELDEDCGYSVRVICDTLRFVIKTEGITL